MSTEGIVKRKTAVNATYINIKYCATAGILYVDNQDVQKHMEQIRREFKEEFGPNRIPKYDDSTNTAFYVKRMAEKGIVDLLPNGKADGIALFGRVTSVQMQQSEATNKLETDYLRVTFEVGGPDDLKRFVISTDFNHKLAQNMIPRLLTIEPGQSAYFCPSPFFGSDDPGKNYPIHGVIMKDENDRPIKRLDGFSDDLKTKQTAFLEEIKASGADMNDPDVREQVKEMLESQRRSFFMGMFREVERRFSVPREDRSGVADEGLKEDMEAEKTDRPF